jgi:probable phosphoglycerate mutase
VSDDRGPQLIVVRHGETQWSRLGRHTGRTDIALTALGESMAAGLAERLGRLTFEAVIASPLLRARRTAELAGYGSRMQVDDDLAEWDYGNDEGRTGDEITAGRPGWEPWRDGYDGGERLEHVAARARAVIARACARDGDTLAFAHGHLLRILVTQWIEAPAASAKAYALDPSTVSVLGWHRGSRVIRTWNSPA